MNRLHWGLSSALLLGAACASSTPVDPARDAEMKRLAAAAGVPCSAEDMREAMDNNDQARSFVVTCRGQGYRCEPKETGVECKTVPMLRPPR